MKFCNAVEAIEELCAVYNEEEAMALLEALYLYSLRGRENKSDPDERPATTYSFTRHLQELLQLLYQWNGAHAEEMRSSLLQQREGG